ncbi:MAG: PorT family protein [Bacteroidales bacterium]|nr:PorT family protein [Bacteroidales bacterium]
MKIKFHILFISILLINYNAIAQQEKVKYNPEYDDKPVHFGYTLGINVMDFSFGRYYLRNPNVDTLYADLTNLNFGFQVGMIADFRLGEYFNFRVLPSFNFGQRDLKFFVNKGSKGMQQQISFSIESSMLDLPLIIKYKAKRINNYRPYMIAGTSFRYDLAAKKKYKIDEGEYVLLRPFDVYGELGMGMDFYLPYFKFSTEIKLSLGVFDVLNHTPPEVHPEYVNSLRKLNSQILMLSFHFE